MKIACPNCKRDVHSVDPGDGWLPARCKNCAARLYISHGEILDRTVEGLAQYIQVKLGGGIIKRVLIALLLHLLTFAMLYAVWGASTMWLDAHASASWPTTPGKIDRLQLILTGRDSSRAELNFRYKVGDQPFSSTRASYNSETETGIAARLLTWKFNVGDAVTVYYNPEKPNFGLLCPGARYSDYLAVALALFGLAIAATCHWLNWLVDKPDKMVQRLQPLRRWAGRLY